MWETALGVPINITIHLSAYRSTTAANSPLCDVATPIGSPLRSTSICLDVIVAKSELVCLEVLPPV